jgi:MSHA biogenesis protein MshN
MVVAAPAGKPSLDRLDWVMSVINRMLRELDRRRAAGGDDGEAMRAQVRAVAAPARASGEWFWRVVAMLMLVAASWTIWVIYQLQPRSVATELAQRAAEGTRRRAPIGPVSTPAPSAATPAVQPPPLAAAEASAAPAAPTQKPAPEKLAAPMEMLRLALTIDTPLAPRPAKSSAKPVSGPHGLAPSDSAARAPAAPASVRVEKRDREREPGDQAEMEFRRAATLLNSGRVADGEDALIAALNADRSHQAARQTLIALYLEQRRIDDALGHLQAGLDANPSYAAFAVALARIHVDRRNYDEALRVLEQAKGTGQGSADLHALRGAVLQRLARQAEAADAYRMALNSGPQTGTSWIGLGISLEALGRRAEAAEAFRRGIATGTLTADVKAYAEQRVLNLQ